MQQFLNQVEPAVISAAFAVLTAFIGAVGTAAVKFINTKKTALVKQIGVDEYNRKLTLARQVWNLVDETFRITPTLEKTVAAKQEAFAAQIEKIIPGISADEIEQLRQTVAGEINKGRTALTDTADNSEKSESADVLQSTAKSADSSAVPANDPISNDTQAADSAQSAQNQVAPVPQNITVNVTVPANATPDQIVAAVQAAQTAPTKAIALPVTAAQ